MSGVTLVAAWMKSGLIFPVGGGGVVPAMVLIVTRASGPPPCVRVLLFLLASPRQALLRT
jgi:hypothetical protein